MKAKAKAILLAVIACVTLSSCDTCNKVETANGEDDTSMFVLVETAAHWYVVYHKDTKVMYAVSAGQKKLRYSYAAC